MKTYMFKKLLSCTMPQKVVGAHKAFVRVYRNVHTHTHARAWLQLMVEAEENKLEFGASFICYFIHAL